MIIVESLRLVTVLFLQHVCYVSLAIVVYDHSFVVCLFSDGRGLVFDLSPWK